ncbi:MAG: hypothetical protein E7470_02450 [Ruminococcaceae bacterium]|nr:hypothetical protein [Oscillospiraceae bacterium]
MGWRAVFMLNSIPIAVILGILLGFLAGLGVGGGSLLMLWLTLVINTDHETARTINLMFFIVAAGSVSLLRLKNQSLSIKPILPAIVTGCLGAALCSWIGTRIELNIIRKIFGGLLIITGLRELFYRPRNAK